MRNVRVLLLSPTSGATNTSSTVTLQGRVLDPLRRAVSISFQLDRVGTFASPDLQTSSNVNGLGWADTPLSWASAAIGNGDWYYRGRTATALVGAGPTIPAQRYAGAIGFMQAGGAGIPRSLYLYVNKGKESIVPAVGSYARSLYLYVNKGMQAQTVDARVLYLYVNRGFTNDVEARALYLYRNARDGEVFPYLNHLSPEEQYELGQVELFGDGFGQYLDCTQLPTTLSVSSTNGGNVAGNARDGTAAEWQSTSGAAAWIRATFSATKRIHAIALEGPTNGTSWGIPRFRFSDASQEDGTVTVPNGVAGDRSTEYPVSYHRHLYVLSAPKDTDYVEIAIASGGSGTNRGFAEILILEEAVPKEAAETSRAVLNLGLPSEQTMGIVLWQNRSPNLYPANSGVPLLSAATVTVPTGAVSGLVYVEETT